MYRDVETGETVTREQLEAEYIDAVKAGSIDAVEQTIDQYIHNCLAAFGGTLIIERR